MRAKALRLFSKNDPILAQHIRDYGPYALVPSRTGTPFTALARAICYQQLHGKAAATIWERTRKVCGGPRVFNPRRVLAASEKELRGAGLSKNKFLALKDLAQHAATEKHYTWKKLEALEDEEIIERLTAVRGIGVWTVQMLLMFSLGRPDVLPIHDYGVQKGFSLLYGTKEHPTPKSLLLHGERWRPYRSVAAWYLWRMVDLNVAKQK